MTHSDRRTPIETQESNLHINRTVFRDDHEMLRTTAQCFLQRECLPKQGEWDKAGRVDRETWLKAGREGLLCLMMLPTEYGGGDFGHAAVLNEEIQRLGVSGLGFSVHSDIIAPYIARLGNEEQKQRWLPKVCSGESILAIGMTEPGTGSDLKAIRTIALREGDEYVIKRQQDVHQQRAECRSRHHGVQDRPGRGIEGREPHRRRSGS